MARLGVGYFTSLGHQIISARVKVLDHHKLLFCSDFNPRLFATTLITKLTFKIKRNISPIMICGKNLIVQQAFVHFLIIHAYLPR
jgi:hypothetical protein